MKGPVIFFLGLLAIGLFAIPNSLAIFEGGHMWYGLAPGVPCGKCHANLLDQLELSEVHTSFGSGDAACRACHQTMGFREISGNFGTLDGNFGAPDGNFGDLKSKTHATITPTCVDCHPKFHESLTNYTDVHRELYTGSIENQKDNWACLGCHTRTNINITFERPKGIKLIAEIDDSTGNWSNSLSYYGRERVRVYAGGAFRMSPEENASVDEAGYSNEVKKSVMSKLVGSGGYGFDNRLLPLYGGNSSANWEVCGRCHIGGAPGNDNSRETPVDCAACHDPEYSFSSRYYNSTLGKWNYSLSDSGARKWRINRKQALEACLNCHGEPFRYKRGTPFRSDLHYEMGCLTCHQESSHLFARGKEVADMMANDRPLTRVSCTNCHLEMDKHITPLDPRVDDGIYWNKKHKRVACKTCHIPEIRGWIFRKFTDRDDLTRVKNYVPISSVKPFEKINNDVLEERDFENNPTGNFGRLSEFNVDGNFGYVFKWWDGTKNSSEPTLFPPVFTDINDSDATLQPFKIVYSNRSWVSEIESTYVQVSHYTREDYYVPCQRCHEDPGARKIGAPEEPWKN